MPQKFNILISKGRVGDTCSSTAQVEKENHQFRRKTISEYKSEKFFLHLNLIVVISFTRHSYMVTFLLYR